MIDTTRTTTRPFCCNFVTQQLEENQTHVLSLNAVIWKERTSGKRPTFADSTTQRWKEKGLLVKVYGTEKKSKTENNLEVVWRTLAIQGRITTTREAN